MGNCRRGEQCGSAVEASECGREVMVIEGRGAAAVKASTCVNVGSLAFSQSKGQHTFTPGDVVNDEDVLQLRAHGGH